MGCSAFFDFDTAATMIETMNMRSKAYIPIEYAPRSGSKRYSSLSSAVRNRTSGANHSIVQMMEDVRKAPLRPVSAEIRWYRHSTVKNSSTTI